MSQPSESAVKCDKNGVITYQMDSNNMQRLVRFQSNGNVACWKVIGGLWNRLEYHSWRRLPDEDFDKIKSLNQLAATFFDDDVSPD